MNTVLDPAIAPVNFGRVSSADLMEPREQYVLDFYAANRGRYRRALDIGANIGVHTLAMARLGWSVRAFEPDPQHFEQLRANVERAGLSQRVVLYPYALAAQHGPAEFVRVLDNTTANHLAGRRAHHGPIERVVVDCIQPGAYFEEADLVKMDCEGAEAELVEQLRPEHDCDLIIEVGSAEAADRIFAHLVRQGRHLIHWAPGGVRGITRRADMPEHYREGHLFVSRLAFS